MQYEITILSKQLIFIEYLFNVPDYCSLNSHFFNPQNILLEWLLLLPSFADGKKPEA